MQIQKTFTRCDRCSAEFDGRPKLILCLVGSGHGYGEDEKLELCESCSSSFRRWREGDEDTSDPVTCENCGVHLPMHEPNCIAQFGEERTS